jgi:hypothetical protein
MIGPNSESTFSAAWQLQRTCIVFVCTTIIRRRPILGSTTQLPPPPNPSISHTHKKSVHTISPFLSLSLSDRRRKSEKGAILVGRRQRFRSGFLFHPPCSIGSPLAGCSGVSGDVREEQWGGDVGGAGGEGDERHAHRPRLGDEPRDLRHPQPRPWVRPISGFSCSLTISLFYWSLYYLVRLPPFFSLSLSLSFKILLKVTFLFGGRFSVL